MIEIGSHNSLKVVETRPNGLLLDAGMADPLLLPIELVDRTYLAGDTADVFIYLSADGDPVATTQQPVVEKGQVGWLQVIDVNQLGAFADWGLPRDLFIPFAEQQHPLRKGEHALVRVYLDNQQRLAGSTRTDYWIKDDATGLEPGEEVSLIIGDRTELGFKAIINHRSWGLLYGNELFKSIAKGQCVIGYIKRIRADGKIDLSLEKPGFNQVRLNSLAEDILDRLEANAGQLPLTDKSPPETIYATFGVSKRAFKQALGALYKQRRIAIHAHEIELLK